MMNLFNLLFDEKMSSHEPYFATYIQDLEQEPFDAVDFVERLAWRMGKGESVNAAFLKNKFEEEIGSLQLLSEQFQSKINSLEQQQNGIKTNYLDTLSRLYDRNSESLEKLKQLDGTMQTISAKVVHLGDQLESVHAPRARAFEALQLMRHFDEFLASDQPLNSPIFTDPERLLQSAEMIHKLSSIAQELSREKYASVQMRIAHKYDEIEELLIEEFAKSHDKKRLREIALILSDFKAYTRCLDDFIERIQNSAFRSGNVFEDIFVLCEKTSLMFVEIFPNPTQVMDKLILNVFYGKLQETINLKLNELECDSEAFLTNLSDLYSKTLKLQKKLEKLKSDTDPQFLLTLVQSIFGSYLKKYVEKEQQYIHDQCTTIIRFFYESKNHQKRNILHAGIKARLLNVESFGNETFLSEEVAINLIQEVKNSLARCVLLCKGDESLKLIQNLFEILVKFLYNEHVDYAVDLAISAIPTTESKTVPPLNFFGVVQQSSSITHLFVKNFEDVIYSLVKNTKIEDLVVKKRDKILTNVENRINLGLERQLNCIISYAKFVLSNEQKKSDFKPEDESRDIYVMSKACSLVTVFLRNVVERICESVDGGNLKILLNELGDRFYSTLLPHIRSFNYNTTGAMLLLCDINEYKRCVSSWGARDVLKKFDLLRELANLLVVVPESLSKASTSQSLVNVDRELVNSFIQLRHDYRTAKLYMNTY